MRVMIGMIDAADLIHEVYSIELLLPEVKVKELASLYLPVQACTLPPELGLSRLYNYYLALLREVDSPLPG